MTERYAIYYAPAAESALWRKAAEWLDQPDIAPLAVSARRYGFHATLKAPMALRAGADRAALLAAVEDFSQTHAPVGMGPVGAHLIDGFLALTPVRQPEALTDFAAEVVQAFEPLRAPLSADDRARRLKAPLTPRQIELLDAWGYPYVLEEFQLHMTLTDRLAPEQRPALQARAAEWFADALAVPLTLDRLVVFHEAAPGAPFRRLDGDFLLKGPLT